MLEVNITSSDTSLAGTPFDITCTVSEIIDGLTSMPNIEWLRQDNRNPVSNSQDVFISTYRADSMAVSVLTLSALRPSQAIPYLCVGSVLSLGEFRTEESVANVAIDCKWYNMNSFISLLIHSINR